jgi:ssDNA-binding Zn-finger/Zn-ribbon topoisomerase 1
MTFLDYFQRRRRRVDLTAWACPKCAFESKTHTSRTCPECGYTGDWVQPGQYLTYAEQRTP